MYLMVAYIQGQKGDYVVAKRTFHEASQLELEGTPRFDSNLCEIGLAQARMGLLDEAKKTASMILDPSLRESVEYTIRQRSPGQE